MRGFAFAFLSVPLLAASVTPLQFRQVDYYAKGALILAHSATGRLDVAFVQDPQGISFLNVVQSTANGNTWMVANLPLPSTAETGTTSFNVTAYYNLGVPAGTDLTTSPVNYYYTVSSETMTAMPPPPAGFSSDIEKPKVIAGNGAAPMGSVPHDVGTCVSPGPAVTTTPPTGVSASYPRAESTKQIWHQHTGDVPTPTNYCAPAAAVNGLQFLAANNGYTLTDGPSTALTNMATNMKTDPNSGGTTEQGAATGLLTYTSANKLPVEVHYAGGTGGATGLPQNTDFTTPGGTGFAHNDGPVTWDYIWSQMQKGQSVILMGAGHVIVVEGLVDNDLGGGEHQHIVYYRDDPNQGQSKPEDLADYHPTIEVSATDPPYFRDQLSQYNAQNAINVVLSTSPLPYATSSQSIPQTGHVALNLGTTTASGCMPAMQNLFQTSFLSGDLAVLPNNLATFNFGPLAHFTGSIVPATGAAVFNYTLITSSGDLDTGTTGTSTLYQLNLNNARSVLVTGLELPQLNGTLSIPAIPSCSIPIVGYNIVSGVPLIQTDAATGGDPVSLATGELLEDPPPDLSLGGPLPLIFQRHYGSLLAYNGIIGALGLNWTHNFDTHAFVSGTDASVTTPQGNLIRFLIKGGAWNLVPGYKFGYEFATISTGYQFLDAADNLLYTFGPDGKLISIADRKINKLTVTQGAFGPTQISDGLGRTLTFTYSTDGHITKVADQSGRSVSFGYNGQYLLSVTDAAGRISTFTISGEGLLSGLIFKTTLPAGNTAFAQTYDNNGRVGTQADGLGNSTSIVYSTTVPGVAAITDANGNTTTQTHLNLIDFTGSSDANGNTTVTGYDSNSRPTSMVNRNGNIASATYHNPSGYLAFLTDFDGHTTTLTYAPTVQNGFTFFDLTKIVYPDGSSTSYTYDSSGNQISAGTTYNARGQILTTTNGLGGVTTYKYNGADATLASITSPAGDVTTYTYDSLKRVSTITFADKSTQSFTYDALDRPIKLTDERSKTTALAYTPNHEVASITDPLGNATSFAYDAAENLIAINAPTGSTSVSYNKVSLPSGITDATGKTLSLTYDNLNRLSTIGDAAGPLASFEYTPEGAITTATDGANRIFTAVPDHFGRPRIMGTPLGEFWLRSYDTRGRLASWQDPLGNQGSQTFDARGRVTGINLPGAQQSIIAYNALGGIASVTDPNGSAWTRTYDTMGRLASRTDPLGQSVSFSYGQRNRVASASSALGKAKFTYDASGNLTKKLFDDGTELDFSYDDASRMTSATGVSLAFDASGRIVNSNGLAITRDASGRITSIAYTPGAVTYSYDQRGNLATIQDWTGAVTSFAYDPSLRLSTITRPTGIVTQLTYDPDGNLAGTSETGNSGPISTITLTRDAASRIIGSNRSLPQSASPASGFEGYNYDAAHQITGSTYDPLGRLNTDPLRTYTWDLASRLTSYTGADGAASFSYDALGSRISRNSENYVINYGLALPSVAVAQSAGADERYYIHLPNGMLLASIEAADNSHHYFHFDENGSTLFLSDDTGSVTDSYGITPYGESVTQTGSTPNPFTWQGAFGVMQELGTSMYYMRARYYDSAPARFLSRDPAASIAPNQISPYQYAVANPVEFNDPTGLSPGRIAISSNFGVVTLPPGIDSRLNLFTDDCGISSPLVRFQSGFEKNLLDGQQQMNVLNPLQLNGTPQFPSLIDPLTAPIVPNPFNVPFGSTGTPLSILPSPLNLQLPSDPALSESYKKLLHLWPQVIQSDTNRSIR